MPLIDPARNLPQISLLVPTTTTLPDKAACDLEAVLTTFESWLAAQDYRGYDPHDALNSPFLEFLTGRSRVLGLVMLQLLKRSPINLRPFFGIKPGCNAKGMGLFLEAYARLYAASGEQRYRQRAESFARWLDENSIRGYPGACWGYDFPWANRHFYAPRHTPNVVTTSFVGHALLEFYQLTHHARWLHLAKSACDFICRGLNRIPDGQTFSFSYTPLDEFCIHNANMLAAALLARVAALTNDAAYFELAESSMRYSLNRQQPEGAWLYGEAWHNRWIDSFHTGYSLVALKQFIDARQDGMGREALARGARFYRQIFFDADGRVKYYHNKIYPFESHAFAHALIALDELGDLIEDADELSNRVLQACLKLFWDPAGFFYYRRQRFFTIKTSFMRWTQAWMFLGLTRVYARAVRE